MSVKQASVALNEIQWALLPSSWSLLIKEDWQNKTTGLNQTAEVANEANVTANDEKLRNDTQDESILSNTNDLKLANNKVAGIDKKVKDIAVDVERNKQGIETNKQNLKGHESSNSEHGVAGDNVGTEDYCTDTAGGVVLLASNIAELTTYTAPSAPATYDQTEEQAFRDGVQSQLNDIISKANEIIKGQIASKQMGTL